MKKEIKNVNIGLDIGIASVGWAVLDEKFNILKHGVRLFDKMEHPTTNKLKNEERREARSFRRQKNRKITRKNDFIKWLNEMGWIDVLINKNEKNHKYRYDFIEKYIKNNESPFNLRLKGLKQKLTKKELIIVLYFYLNLRGFKYTIAGNEETTKIKDKYEDIDFKKDLPIEIQNTFYKKHAYYRSDINRNFHSSAYEKEIKYILNKSKISQKIQTEFIDGFLHRQRDYEQGPLSEEAIKKIKDKTQISQYSRFSYDPKTKKITIRKNMWEGTEGKCTYFKEEKRINKNSFSAEIFNLLNDLNNISIEKKKLTTKEKKEIINISLKKKSNANSALKYLSTTYEVDEGEIEGLRIDKSNKKLLTQLDSYHVIKKANDLLINEEKLFENNFVNEEINKINKIIQTLSQSKQIEKREEELKKIKGEFNHLNNKNETIKKLSEIKNSFSKTHSLSKKAIDGMLPYLLNENLNQMQIAHNLEWKSNEDIDFSKYKYIPLNWTDDSNFIASPTTKRAIRQSIKVLNRLIKSHKNWKIKNIVIEMAKDLNGKQEKESINNLQKFLENRRNSIKEEIEDFEKKQNKTIPGSVIAKLWLWKQQKGLDAYTGKKLDKNKVMMDPTYTDIDHIIPYSFCFDNSLNNKVLTLSNINSQKSNKQPFAYLGEEKLNDMFEKFWKDWYSPKKEMKDRKGFFSTKKLGHLMDIKDYSNPKNSFDFIGRNLVDTRYATKKVLSILKMFIEKQKQDSALYETKTKTINGKLTSIFRRMIDTMKNPLKRPGDIEDGSFDEKTGKKERIWNGHHAEDAVIVVHAALKNIQLNKYIEKISSEPYMNKEKISQFIKEKIGDKWNESNKNKIIDFAFVRNSLNEKINDVYFSYMINKKSNTQLFNETTYSGKHIKINDDKEKTFYKVEKIVFGKINNSNFEKEKSKLENEKIFIPMKKYDKKTFDIVLKAFENNDLKSFEEKLDNKKRLIIQNGKNKRYISQIKYIQTQKNEKEIIFIKNPNKKDSFTSFKESMKWFAIEIYKDNNGKNHLIPLNALNCKIIKNGNYFKYEYKNEYWKQLEAKKLNKEMENIKIYYGSIIEDICGNLYRVNGHAAKRYIIELKPVNKNIPIKNKEKRYYGINTEIRNWSLIEVNEIGEKINKKFIF